MRSAVVARYIGLIFVLNAAFMGVSLLVSLGYGDGAQMPLLVSTALAAVVGTALLIFLPPQSDINTREGYIIVMFGWVASCLLGMLPYLFYGGIFSLPNAWFESVSGYTTTGSSIVRNVEALPHGLLFWRSATHWLGGVGVVVFTLLVLPSIGSAKMRLSRMQTSVRYVDAKYNTPQLVRVVLGMYAGLTVTLTLLLWLAGMNLFDAVNHALSTIATGGFSTRNTSIMSYESPLIEGILITFMLISSINFGLLYVAIFKRFTALFNSPVVRYFLVSLAVGIALTTVDLVHSGGYTSWPHALRDAAFQLVSVASTTGFASCSTACWPSFAMLLSFFYMLQCGCSGSTAGGIKADRILIFYKTFVARVRKMLHPNAIVSVRLRGIAIDEDVVSGTSLFIVLYLMLTFAAALLLLASGLDLTTGISAAVASMSNLGPGYGLVHSLGCYDVFSPFAKIVCTVFMLLGRLEIYGVVMLFYYRYWR